MSPAVRAAVAALAVVLAPGALAQSAAERLEVWDLALGTPAAALPGRFVDFACATRDGLPGLPIAGFPEHGRCRADARGWTEVTFAYDDEAGFAARARGDDIAAGRYAGTRVHGYPAMVSALFDTGGVLVGLRIVTDNRGLQPAERARNWSLGGLLRRQFAALAWRCADVPLAAAERAVGRRPIRWLCTAEAGRRSYRIESVYLQRAGHEFVDAFGKVHPGDFVSTTAFEMLIRR